MEAVKKIAQESTFPITWVDWYRRDIPVPCSDILRPCSGDFAGNALHNYLEFGVQDLGLKPLVDAFRSKYTWHACHCLSEQRVYLPNVYQGFVDRGYMGRKVIHIFEFKWAMGGLSLKPRDVDVRQVSLYAY